MRLSVIVTCTQPWPEVRGCLARLLPQSRPGDIEILVADGSHDGLDPATTEQVTWLCRPGWGPHELRLLGLMEAQGDVVAITEDHCDVAPDWCEHVIAAHERCPGVVAVAGPGPTAPTGTLRIAPASSSSTVATFPVAASARRTGSYPPDRTSPTSGKM